MTKCDRLMAAVGGREVDRVPVSMWRHFPNGDRTAEELAGRTVEFQRRFDFDFIKLTPMGLYGVEDWGTVPKYFPGSQKPPVPARFAVVDETGWDRIGRLSVSAGRYGQEVHAVRIVREGIGNEVPILQTLFSPMTTALKLAGEFAVACLRGSSARLGKALSAIAETTVEFAQACLKAGADGFFFATKCASAEVVTEQEHDALVRSSDLAVLDVLASWDALLMLHVHGLKPHVKLLLEYPAHIVNWHDRRTRLSLRDARNLTSRCLAGGIDERGTLVEGTIDEIVRQVTDALMQTGGKGLIITPGCVVPPECEDMRYQAVLDAALARTGAPARQV